MDFKGKRRDKMSSSTAGSLSSGSDYNDLISNLLEIKRQPIYILENRKYTYNKKINTYSDLSAKLLSLKSALDKLRISSNFYAKSVLVSDSTVLNVTLSGATPIGNYSISVSTLASMEKDVHRGVALPTTVVNKSGSDKIFVYNYAETVRAITVADNTALEGLRDLINDDTNNPGVTAFIINDGSSCRLSIKGNDMGSTNKIIVEDSTTLDGSNNTVDFTKSVFIRTKQAKDAVFTFDGILISRSSNTIDDVIEGLTMNLYRGDGSTSLISVTPDVNSAGNKINDFVNAYNDVVSFLSANTEDDSTKGACSMFSGEGTARNIENKLRSAVSGNASGPPGDFKLLARIGITTDSKTGKLNINGNTLESELVSNLDEVAKLFKDTSDGAAIQIYDYLDNIMSNVEGPIAQRKESLRDIIDNIENTIRKIEHGLNKTKEDLVGKLSLFCL
jgi:flagellar hook-associated protein 2